MPLSTPVQQHLKNTNYFYQRIWRCERCSLLTKCFQNGIDKAISRLRLWKLLVQEYLKKERTLFKK